MREPKPLGKAAREEVAKRIAESLDTNAWCWLQDLLRAEQFWREAVKGMTPVVQIGTQMRCGICGGVSDNPESFKTIHEPTCPWLLAQD